MLVQDLREDLGPHVVLSDAFAALDGFAFVAVDDFVTCFFTLIQQFWGRVLADQLGLAYIRTGPVERPRVARRGPMNGGRF